MSWFECAGYLIGDKRRRGGIRLDTSNGNQCMNGYGMGISGLDGDGNGKRGETRDSYRLEKIM